MVSLRRKLATVISILALILILLPVITPYIIAGPPTPFFSIRNHDDKGHELRVEIYDSKNNSVFNETYELSVGEEVYYPKPFRFLVPISEAANYEFKFILDNNLTKTYTTNIQPWNTVEAELYSDYEEDKVLSIGEITV